MTAALTLEAPTMNENQSQPQTPNEAIMGPSCTIERIVMTGFMGSGKSTVGALLAAKLRWAFIDLDAEIERRAGKAVPAIFAESGEPEFRRQETSALASVLGKTQVVIALGGGAPEALGNRLLLEQTPSTAVVFLHAPFPVLHERCMRQAALPGATERPVLADRAAAEARFHARLRHYERIADLKLDTSDISQSETLAVLLTQLPRLA
jgi:shikimate kinase